MPDATQPKPVFIDQTPEYQQAMQSVMALSQDETAFRAKVNDLGLTDELQKLKTAMVSLKPQGEALMLKAQQLMQTKENEVRHAATRTGIVGLIGGAITAVAVFFGVRNRDWKGWYKGLATAGSFLLGMPIIGGIARALGKKPDLDIANTPEAKAMEVEQQQLAIKGMEIQKPFMEAMATRMVEQQKALAGKGADAQLVSTATPQVVTASAAVTQTPAPSDGMTAKYATPPAASKAEAVIKSKEASTSAQIGA